MIDRGDLTAAAGPVLAVDRRRFLALGGYDPIYFPGRIEDLDLGFRSWMAGFRGYYVPESVAFHKGLGTFEPELGKGRVRCAGEPQHADLHVEEHGRSAVVGHFFWLPVRVAVRSLAGRPSFVAGYSGPFAACADQVLAARRALAVGQGGWIERQEAFFRRFQSGPRSEARRKSAADGVGRSVVTDEGRRSRWVSGRIGLGTKVWSTQGGD